MIELAPHNPYGLALRSPVIVAPGCAAPLRDLDPTLIGAVATRTAVLHLPSEERMRWATVPAGIVFEQLPAIRFRALLQTEARRWRRSPVPVLLSLRGTPDDLAEMTARLEQIEGIAGVLIQADATGVVPAVDAARSQTTLPLLTILPPQSDPASAMEIVAAGADALVVGAYPQTAAVVDDAVINGALVGPTLVPWTLRALQQATGVVDVPLIALGGVADAAIARRYLAAGATALMVDAALYGDPFAPRRIAAALNVA